MPSVSFVPKNISKQSKLKLFVTKYNTNVSKIDQVINRKCTKYKYVGILEWTFPNPDYLFHFGRRLPR